MSEFKIYLLCIADIVIGTFTWTLLTYGGEGTH